MTRTMLLWLASAGLILAALAGAVRLGSGPSSGAETCTTYASTEPPTVIPHNTTTFYTLNITDSFAVTDVNVRPINITHPWVSDLNVHLNSPGSVRVELFTNLDGDGDNFVDTVLDDASTNSIGLATPIYRNIQPGRTALWLQWWGVDGRLAARNTR